MRLRCCFANLKHESFALGLALLCECGVDAWSVEADDNLTVNVEHGYAHLAGLLDGFIGVFHLLFDVALFECNALLGQIIFGRVAESAPVSTVDDDMFLVHTLIVALYYTL